MDPIAMGANAGSSIVSAVGNGLREILGNQMGQQRSLVDIARAGQVAPYCIIESDLRFNPNTKDLLHVLTTLFAGIYLMAQQYEDNLGDVKIIQRLDKFNPARKPMLSSESLDSTFEQFGMITMEAYDKSNRKAPDPLTTPINNSDNSEAFTEDRNLAVGKVVQVEMHDKSGNLRKVNISIGLHPLVMDSESLLYAFSRGSRSNSSEERFLRAWHGDISWIADWLFKRDLIHEHRKALFNDKSGVVSAMSRRNTSNLMAAITSGEPSLAAASSILVVSATTAELLERRLMGRLSLPETRDTFFAQTGLMILVVYDPKWERYTFYLRDQNEGIKLAHSEIKSKSKKSSEDLGPLLEQLLQNNVRTL